MHAEKQSSKGFRFLSFLSYGVVIGSAQTLSGQESKLFYLIDLKGGFSDLSVKAE